MNLLELEICAHIAELEERLKHDPEDWQAAQDIRLLTNLVESAHITAKEAHDAHRSDPRRSPPA